MIEQLVCKLDAKFRNAISTTSSPNNVTHFDWSFRPTTKGFSKLLCVVTLDKKIIFSTELWSLTSSRWRIWLAAHKLQSFPMIFDLFGRELKKQTLSEIQNNLKKKNLQFFCSQKVSKNEMLRKSFATSISAKDPSRKVRLLQILWAKVRVLWARCFRPWSKNKQLKSFWIVQQVQTKKEILWKKPEAVDVVTILKANVTKKRSTFSQIFLQKLMLSTSKSNKSLSKFGRRV